MNRYCGGVASLIVVVALFGVAAVPASASHVKSTSPINRDQTTRLVMPLMNPERGKVLFVSKGCVACHAINGVGGHDAPPMDAHQMNRLMNPFDFAAKMWNHAPAMIAAQEGAIGEQIYFTGNELADIIAFIHDDQAQHAFSEKDITAAARKMMHHDHGGKPAEKHHGPEIGHPGGGTGGHHPHAPGMPPHKD
ncbi:MAG: cytochrome c [Rhodospirillales bacterium]|nr:cytochrome c [Rhodospirillales bacterium]MBI2978377.1 cytochrome c [Rhodospirillales bacterium]